MESTGRDLLDPCEVRDLGGTGPVLGVPIADLTVLPRPQAQTDRFAVKASENSAPAAIATTPVSGPVAVRLCTGVGRFVVLPSPSCPWLFSPQAKTVPSDLR
jgi:hypothetical protein